MVYKSLCLSGGSIKGFCELGALHYLYSNDFYNYDDIETYIGTSIGSIICILLSIGYTPMEILIRATKIDIFIDYEISDFLNFKRDGGLLDIRSFLKYVDTMILQKIHCIPTMKQLHELTRKKLIITTTNVTKGCTEYIDYETFPDLSCLDALRMSCSMPIVFKRVEYNGCYYVDGGIIDNFPIEKIDDGSDILAIYIQGSNIGNGFMEYVYSLFSLPIDTLQKNKIQRLKKNCWLINIKATTSSLEFKLTKDNKIKLFTEGYNNAKEQIEERLYEEWNE